jgi:sugar phosphate permease
MQTNTFGRLFIMPWIICSLGALFYCYEYFLRIAPGVMAPELMHAYDLTGTQFGMLGTSYYIAYVPMQIIVGLMVDRFGPRRLLFFACLLCAVGAYVFAVTDSFMIAVLGRFLIGFGSAFGFVGALKLATIWLPPNRFALVSGIIMCLAMLGAVAGNFLLREMVDVLGWQATMYVSALVGFCLSFVIIAIVRDVNPHPMIHYVHHISFKEILVGLWLSIRNSQIWFSGLVGLLLYVSLAAFAELWGVQYLQGAHALSKAQAVSANSMVFWGWACGAPFWGWFSDFIKCRATPLFIGSIGGLITFSILLYCTHLSALTIYLLLFAFGFFSSVQILIFAICHEASHIKIAGTAIAITNLVIMVSGLVYPPLIGKILDFCWLGGIVEGARAYPSDAYQYALTVIPLSYILAIVVIFFIRETKCSVRYH